MENQQGNIEQTLKESLQNEAEAIREKIRISDIKDISEEQNETIQKKLQKRIAQQETEFSEELTDIDIYAKLSKEDREALELGRKVKERQRHMRKRRSRKLYIALAAAIILVLAIGMTSMGGAERIVRVIKQAVGEREVTKVTSDEDYIVMENEDEEKAYQKIKDTFGVEPVKFIRPLEKMKFIQMDLDENLQVAKLLYRYDEENIIYIISADYMGSSFGIDVEDELLEREEIKIGETVVELSVYQINGSKDVRCSASYRYKGLEYFLMGAVNKKEFQEILNNLYFF